MKEKQAKKLLNKLMSEVDSKYALIQPFLDHFNLHWKDSVKVDGDETTTDNTRVYFKRLEAFYRGFQLETANDLKRLIKKYPFLKVGLGGRVSTPEELGKHINLGSLCSVDTTAGDIWLVGDIGSPSFRIAVKCLKKALDYMNKNN